ncbi:MAG: tetratricopeptide repeat protein [Phycisphaerae bacterium]|nr:tetratricopeptide repeat protein [Phycisphaerae bacterium]
MMRYLTVCCLGVIALAAPLRAQDSTAANIVGDEAAAEAVAEEEPTAPLENVDELKAMSFEELLAEARRLIDDGEIRKSIPYIQMARTRDDTSPGLKTLRGEVLLATGNIQEARPLLMEAYHADANDFRVNYALGRLYLGTRIWRQAYVYLEHAEQLAPLDRSTEVQRALAEAYLGARQISRATEFAEKAARGARGQDNEYTVWRTLVAVLIENREFERAISEAEHLVELAEREYTADPGDAKKLTQLSNARQILVAALQTSGTELFASGPDGMPTDQVVPGAEARVAALIKHVGEIMALQAEVQRILAYHDVVTLAERAVQYDPTNADYQRDLGLLLVEISKYDEAIVAFEKALELNPGDQISARNLELLRGKQPTSQPASSTPGDTPAETP